MISLQVQRKVKILIQIPISLTLITEWFQVQNTTISWSGSLPTFSNTAWFKLAAYPDQ